MKQRRAFDIHPALIFDVICKQAGSISKAILEGVMNSVDAGSSECRIEIGINSYTIHDDGKGFASMEEIESFFETFGTPHTEGDARFGRFRMGRGQGFAFGRNRWRTGEFFMDVDIKKKGLDYDLQTGMEPKKGCSIEVELYEPNTPLELQSLKSAVKSLVEWIDIPIYLNGTSVNKSRDEVDWTVKAPGFLIKKTSSGGVQFYNQGAFVCTHSSFHHRGISALVLSLEPLAVNFARNDILTKECRIYPAVRKELLRIAAEDERRSQNRLNDDTRRALFCSLCSRQETDPDEIKRLIDKSIVPIAGGRYCSPRALFRALAYDRTAVITPSDTSKRIIDRLRVIHPHYLFVTTHVMEWLGLHDNDEISLCDTLMGPIFDLLVHDNLRYKSEFDKHAFLARHDHVIQHNRKTALPNFSAISREIRDSHEIIKRTEYTEMERISLNAIRYYYRGSRIILLGSSETSEAWTNSSSYIAVDRAFLNRHIKQGIKGFMRIMMVILHEETHNVLHTDTDVHDVEFYENYHDAAISQPWAYTGYSAALKFASDLIEKDMKVPSTLRSDLEKVYGNKSLRSASTTP